LNKILYWLTTRPLFALIGKAYTALRKMLEGIPGFDAYTRIATTITDRVFAVVRLPASMEKRFDPYIEFEHGRSMDRALVFAVLVYMAVLGAYPSNLGHLDTAPHIWIALPIVSGFNPYLGLVSGIVFSVFDWVGKFLPFESVYGADFGSGMQNFWGARIGYILAYTTLILNGMLPGILARVFRQFVRGITRSIFPRKATQAAMGIVMLLAAGTLIYHVGGPRSVLMLSAFSMMAMGMAMQPPNMGQQGAAGPQMPQGGGAPEGGEDFMAEAMSTLGSILGATVGIVASYEWAQNVGNYGAFYALRAEADVSCRDLSAGNYSELQGQAPIPGAVAGLMPPGAGGAVTPGGTTPPGGSTPPGGGGTTTPGGGTPPGGGGTTTPGGSTPPGGGGTTTSGGGTTPGNTGTDPQTDPGTEDGNYFNQFLGPGQPGDSQSAFVETDDGRTVSQGFVFDPAADGWRPAEAGESDAHGQVWDASVGAWTDPGAAAAMEQARRDNQAMLERERARAEQRRQEADRRRREAERRRAEVERQRLETERRIRDMAARTARRAELQARVARLEAESARLNAEASWWDRATAVAEGIKLTVDTAANVVAAAAPPPAGTAFAYAYGTATGVAGGMAQAEATGGSMVEGAFMGGMEGVATAAVGRLAGNLVPGASNHMGQGVRQLANTVTRPMANAFSTGMARGSQQALTQGIRRGVNGAIRQFAHNPATQQVIREMIIGEGSAHLTSGAFSTATGGQVSSARVESEADTISTIASWLNPFD